MVLSPRRRSASPKRRSVKRSMSLKRKSAHKSAKKAVGRPKKAKRSSPCKSKSKYPGLTRYTAKNGATYVKINGRVCFVSGASAAYLSKIRKMRGKKKAKKSSPTKSKSS